MPKRLITDLAQLSYVESAGERWLSWLGSIGAVFAARGHQLHIPMLVDAALRRKQKKEE